MPFVCTECRRREPTVRARCRHCDGVVVYEPDDPGAIEAAIDGDRWGALPAVSRRITMGEGETPLVDLSGLTDRLGTGNGDDIEVYAKLESLNPTCSFKDRGSALCASVVADPETSFEAMVVASTGNTASSVAAYAARAGIPCAVVVPAGTASAKLGQVAAHGAEVFAVDGSFSDCFSLAQAIADDRILNATAVYSANPLVTSANRTVAFELLDALSAPPDWVSVPVGAGPLLGGTHAGFREAAVDRPDGDCRAGESSSTGTIPRQLCVQARGCHPIVEAFEADRPVEAWERPIETAVGAIADPLVGYAADGEYTRQAVLESGGSAVALADEHVFEWQRILASAAGIYAEPASAASVAAIAESGLVEEGETVVALITGHGLKEPEAGTVAGAPAVDDPIAVDPAAEATIRDALLTG